MNANHMTWLKWIVAATALMALGAAGGYWWAHRTMESAQDSTPSTGATSAKRKVLYWHDPMVPGQRFDKPGKSPFMDMQLVPVYANESEDQGDVRVDPNVVQNIGIRLGKVEKRAFGTHLSAVGDVGFDERLLELVQARVDGYVDHLYVKAPLDGVHRGQKLADIIAPQWAQAQQEYLALLEADSERAQSLRDAARSRLAILGVPEVTIRAVEISRKTQATTTLVAPIEGTVSELGVREGAGFTPGTVLFRINGLSTVWVNAQIPEGDVSAVSRDSKVQARSIAWPGASFTGRVIDLLPQVDPQSRTVTARVALDNPERRLLPGMYVTLDFKGSSTAPQLAVPSEALITTGTRNVVITDRGEGSFDVVEVTSGAERDGWTAIVSGLEEGQSIVLSGQFLIDSEASLRSTVSRLESAPAGGPKP